MCRQLVRVPYNACDGLDDDPFIQGTVDEEAQCRRLCRSEILARACVFDDEHKTCAIYTVECKPIFTSFRPPATMFRWEC